MKLKTIVAALALCAAGSAVAQDVTYNAMPGTDFSKYKTYKWVTIDGPLVCFADCRDKGHRSRANGSSSLVELTGLWVPAS